MGGDRRCMILLARYMDASVVFDGTDSKAAPPAMDRVVIRKALNLRTTPVDDFLVLLSSHPTGFPVPTGRPWADAAMWYRKAIENAGISVPGGDGDGAVACCETDEGCDAEGRYDAAEDLSPVHRLLARLAEMYEIGGHGLQADPNMAGRYCKPNYHCCSRTLNVLNGFVAAFWLSGVKFPNWCFPRIPGFYVLIIQFRVPLVDLRD